MKRNTDRIEIIGAAENNLKHINVNIPKGQLVVFAGVSGSGKSSLASTPWRWSPSGSGSRAIRSFCGTRCPTTTGPR